jgi:hypothetical protein
MSWLGRDADHLAPGFIRIRLRGIATSDRFCCSEARLAPSPL